jgi:putative tryptophan/tyrosine transport system substrate-binding protein
MLIRSLATAATIGLASSLAVAQDVKMVALTFIVDHPAINAARDGIVDALGEAGYFDGKTMKLIVQSAQGSMPTQLQIAKQFAGAKPDLMIAISTPSAQALQSAAGTTPVVFSAVTDPVGAKLVASMERPGANITGTSDMQPLGPTLQLIKSLVPSARRIGIVYNAGEANSVSQVQALKREAGAVALEIVESTASQSAMVGDAARSLVGRVDAILLPTDSTVVSAVESVVAVGDRAKLPVFASDTDSVTRGAIAALGFNYYELGKISGKMAAEVLRGSSPSNMAVGSLKKQDLYLNMKSAAAMGLKVPQDLVASAAKVIN